MRSNRSNIPDELDIPFPEKKFTSYLKKLNISLPQPGATQYYNIKCLYLLMVMDFKKGKISLDELSIMSGYLWGYMDEKSRLGSSLGDTLETASELSFYIRVVQDQECADTLIYFLRKVLKYFDKYAGLPV